ncbi:MAG: acyl-CoA dehydrogenase family protein [Piscinibacter sp.]|jgi:alkylation response protein AidB-like acyl-CoA dehydrogenase|uniref:acyl-CoA dehydrogenase family protein n=1 Tax=Piscinibacter sp. TaxID=1903157 RepID=UPI0011DA4B54|nr:MAG: acyl-CoA dehydrogenase [Burkholderiaceae bacterium]HMZ29521.1 acyl-CoA dehydrogenase family protein [Thauera aminoaromatica]
MDFTFNEDQVALRDSVSRFLMTEAAPEVLRDIWETDRGRSPELRAKLAEQGLTAMSVPEVHGGLDLGDIDWSLMTQELGYYAIPDSLSDTAYVAAMLLRRLGADHPLAARWLPRIAEGSARLALAHPANPWVADALSADLVLHAQATDQGLALHALTPGTVSAVSLPSIDGSRRLAALSCTPNPGTQVLAAPDAQGLWDETLDRAAVNVAGQLVGLAQRMLDLSVDYVAQRKQFGKVIGSFQAVKHHLADVATRIEFARPVLYRAAMAVAVGDRHRAALVSHAKLVCADAAWTAGRKGIQVHGAMGYTWEVDLQMFMKRAWALGAAWGDRAFHKARLADALLADGAPLGPAATLN